MRFIKNKYIIKARSKKYILYAFGEILLTVVGILLALYINNLNNVNKYENSIDNNIVRVYDELNLNISKAWNSIDQLERKDSLLYLLLNDSLKAIDYKQGALWALILNNHSLQLEINGYENLMQLNISDNRYREDLLREIKDLYAINTAIVNMNKVLQEFVVQRSLPLLSDNVDSFVDLVYNRNLKEEAINFYLTSKEYKKLASQYAALTITNQLVYYMNFYKQAIEISNRISNLYQLENDYVDEILNISTDKNVGVYMNEKMEEKYRIKFKKDSLFLHLDTFQNGLNLIPLKENHYFIMQNKRESIFVTFFNNSIDESEEIQMRIHYYSHRREYSKIME